MGSKILKGGKGEELITAKKLEQENKAEESNDVSATLIILATEEKFCGFHRTRSSNT